MPRDTFHILIIEDDRGEQKLLKMLFSAQNLNFTFSFCNDGQEAIHLIDAAKKTASVLPADLIILDLNLPIISGLEILIQLKSTSATSGIPVIMLTTSNNSYDINSAYTHFAAGFIRKPSTIQEYEEIISAICNYWFKTCLLKDNI